MEASSKSLNTRHILDYNMQEEMEHGKYVSVLVQQLARELALDEDMCYELALAGVLHDIGKLRLNRYIYAKQDTLVIEEMKYVRMHAKLSYDILKNRGYSDFVLESILHHHENYDGSGYPDNLLGEEIPLGARLLRVCDVFAALTSDRPYRKSFDHETAMELMIEEVKNFDMRIFLAFQRVVHKEGE